MICFVKTSTRWIKNAYTVHEQPWGAALQFLAMPTSPIDLVRVVGRPNLINLNSMVITSTGRGNTE